MPPAQTVITAIQDRIESYIQKHNIKSLVIGVSGGIDSALVCALVQPTCNKLKIPLYGRSLPIETNEPEEIERSRMVGKVFCDDFVVVDLTDHYYHMKKIDDIEATRGGVIGPITQEDKIRFGNIKARMRMIYLYNLAARQKGMVLSTDNYTEYQLGFSTIMGDWGDYGCIQQLWKTEVYALARYMVNKYRTHETDALDHPLLKAEALEACIEAVPTDGLGITNSDLDQLGAPTYTEVDLILKDYLANGNKSLFCEHPVVKRHLASQFKRNWPVIINRKDLGLYP